MGGVRSQGDPNTLGPTNNPNGDTNKGEYRYSLMILWRGDNLNLCEFKRWKSRTAYVANRKQSFIKGRGWLGPIGEANDTDDPDDGLSAYVYVDPSGKFAVQSDVPGADRLLGANPSYFKYEYFANFYAAAISGQDVKGWIRYNLEIVIPQLNDPNPQNGPPYVVNKSPP